MANIMQMMQKASKFKSRMAELQEKVGSTDISGQSGNGLVTCIMSGKFELKKLKVSPTIISPGDAEMMEDLIVIAINDARQKAEKLMSDETRKLMQELGLPANMDLPF